MNSAQAAGAEYFNLGPIGKEHSGSNSSTAIDVFTGYALGHSSLVCAPRTSRIVKETYKSRDVRKVSS